MRSRPPMATVLWQTLQNVLGEATNNDAGVNTAEGFAAFFRDKVESVRASTMTMTIPPHDVRHRLTLTLERWTPVTIAEVERLIASAPCKTCQLDPVPTWLIKDINVKNCSLSTTYNGDMTHRKQPEARDLLNSNATNGDIRLHVLY